MKRLSESSQIELAQLEDEQVVNLIELELAFSGAEPVPEPVTVEVPEGEKIKPKKTGFIIDSDFFLETKEAVEAFLALNPLTVGYDYTGNHKRYYPSEYHETVEARCESLYEKRDLDMESKSAREKARIINETNQKKYDAYRRQVDKVASEVWENIVRAREFKHDLEHARLTREKYLALVDGNAGKADELMRMNFAGRGDLLAELGIQLE